MMVMGCVLLTPAALFAPCRPQCHRPQQRARQLAMQVSSPFDEKEAEAPARVTGPLDLTEENVELVLDGMRPYLIADGGNVALRDIDGGVVILELQGACGSCPSSSVSRSFPHCLAATHAAYPVCGGGAGREGWGTGLVEHTFPATEPIPPTRQMTMKMGLERGLLETIPEILAVEQVSATGEALCDDTVMEVLDEIRPFLKNMGGDIELIRVDATDLQPSCTLRLTGPSAALRSIKGEIIQARPHDPPFPHPSPSTRPLHTPPHTPPHTRPSIRHVRQTSPPPPYDPPAAPAFTPCVHRRACTLTHASPSPQRLRAKMPTLDGVLWEE